MAVQMTIVLEESDAVAVQAAAREDEISDSALMARAINDYLTRRAAGRLDAYVRATGVDALTAEHRTEDVDVLEEPE